MDDRTPIIIGVGEASERIDSASYAGLSPVELASRAAAAAVWHDEERVGFENTVEVAPGILLTLLLEKDFACLDDSREDQSDNFPNPNAVCG